MIDVWSELSKVYNMKGIPDEAMSIIGDVMLAWSDEQDTISRQAAIDCLCNGKCTEEGRWCDDGDCMPVRRIKSLPSAQPEIKPISYQDCADAMMMMWMDNVLTDGEYRRIMDKLNNHNCKKMPLPEPYKGEQE